MYTYVYSYVLMYNIYIYIYYMSVYSKKTKCSSTRIYPIFKLLGLNVLKVFHGTRSRRCIAWQGNFGIRTCDFHINNCCVATWHMEMQKCEVSTRSLQIWMCQM